jgi:hypothetical protein
VISDIFRVSGRQMLAALIAGQRHPKALAQLARASMRSKIAVLEEALTGHLDDHHGFLCQLMLERIDAATAKNDQERPGHRRDRPGDRPVRPPGRPAGRDHRVGWSPPRS